jgi:hypothetical protein
MAFLSNCRRFIVGANFLSSYDNDSWLLVMWLGSADTSEYFRIEVRLAFSCHPVCWNSFQVFEWPAAKCQRSQTNRNSLLLCKS